MDRREARPTLIKREKFEKSTCGNIKKKIFDVNICLHIYFVRIYFIEFPQVCTAEAVLPFHLSKEILYGIFISPAFGRIKSNLSFVFV